MRRVRKVILTWGEKPPEYFSVSYIGEDGTERGKGFHRGSDESLDGFLQKIGRACISAAKGD